MKTANRDAQIARRAEQKLFRIIFFISLCAMFLLASASCTQKTPSPPKKSAVETTSPAAPPPNVMQIDDAKIKRLLKPGGGKPLLVNFWATWCVPCREEFPDLVKIDAEYRGKIDFFTVSLDFIEDMETTVPNFLKEINAKMPTYVLVSADENTLIPSIYKDWSGALPFTILYNERGEIIFTRQGKVSYEDLSIEIAKVLGEKK